MNKIMQAAQFAAKAHEGQKRKYTGDPYILHPMRVAGRVMLIPNALEEEVCAAWLHDVIEDCGVTEVELNPFGGFVAGLVLQLTEASKGSKSLRAERKQMDRDKLSGVSDLAKTIKILDRIDNLREIEAAPVKFRAMYLAESRLLIEVLRGGNQKLLDELATLVFTLSKRFA